MFYKVGLGDHIRVPPDLFDKPAGEAITTQLRKKYSGFISKELGVVIDVAGMNEIGEGKIIPGDGASYYQVNFELLTFKPELQEVLVGSIKDIADFGAFMTLGPTEGMIHVSQTMDDFVSFSKDKTLDGKESKRTLRVGDSCRARVIAVSFKDVGNPKLGLTMRQPGLGRLDWIEAEGEGKEVKSKESKEKSKENKK